VLSLKITAHIRIIHDAFNVNTGDTALNAKNIRIREAIIPKIKPNLTIKATSFG
jgi:hypothetical protein